MTLPPTVTVKLDNFTGAFPYDISSFVRMVDGVTMFHGRPDEQQTIQPGSLALTLDNTGGDFTLGAAGFGISHDQGIRVIETYPSTWNTNTVPTVSSDFETSVGTWFAAGVTLPTLSSDATRSVVGTKSLKILWNGGASNPQGQIDLPGFTIGNVYTAQIWYYVPTGAPDVRFLGGPFAGTLDSRKDQWVKSTFTFTASAATQSFALRASGTATATTAMWADAFMVNAGPQVGEYNTLTPTTKNRWTGRVQAWPVDWPGGGDSFSTVKVTAIDDLARASRRTLLSALQEEILSRSPSLYYTLGEATGATQAGDSSVNAGPSLTTDGSGTAVVFGTGTGPGTDGLTAATFAGGKFLSAVVPVVTAPTTFGVGVWFNTSTTPGTFAEIAYVNGWQFLVGSTGLLSASGPGLGIASGTSVVDGRTHFAAVTGDGVGTTLWLDGVVLTTAGLPAGSTTGVNSVGGLPSASFPFTGTVSHVAAWPSLSAAAVAAINTAGTTGFAGELPVPRLTRVAGYAGIAVGTLDSAGGTICGPANQVGKSVLDVFNEVASATQGIVYIDASGSVSSISGYTMTGLVTPALSTDANSYGEGTVVIPDMSFVINQATGQAAGSKNVYTAVNTFSVAVHGGYPQALAWNVSTDSQALDRTSWTVNIYAGPASRIPALALDVLSLTGTGPATAMALDLGSYLQLLGMPSQTPAGLTDLLLQGITETVTATTWTLTFNTVPHGLFLAWLLGDPVWGNLGVTTKLYF